MKKGRMNMNLPTSFLLRRSKSPRSRVSTNGANVFVAKQLSSPFAVVTEDEKRKEKGGRKKE